LNNVIEHPWRKRRIAQAKAVVLEILHGLRRDDLLSMRQCHLDDLITTAVVHELEAPGSSLAALKRALDQRTEAWSPGLVTDRPIKIGKRG